MPTSGKVDTVKPEEMPMLQDIEARKAKPKDKPYKLADEKGLYPLVTTTGGKLWRNRQSPRGKPARQAGGEAG